MPHAPDIFSFSVENKSVGNTHLWCWSVIPGSSTRQQYCMKLFVSFWIYLCECRWPMPTLSRTLTLKSCMKINPCNFPNYKKKSERERESAFISPGAVFYEFSYHRYVQKWKIADSTVPKPQRRVFDWLAHLKIWPVLQKLVCTNPVSCEVF